MTRLFIRFYLAVLLVRFWASYINGFVAKSLYPREIGRVAELARRGGVRLLLDQLNATAGRRDPPCRESTELYDSGAIGAVSVSECHGCHVK